MQGPSRLGTQTGSESSGDPGRTKLGDSFQLCYCRRGENSPGQAGNGAESSAQVLGHLLLPHSEMPPV